MMGMEGVPTNLGSSSYGEMDVDGGVRSGGALERRRWDDEDIYRTKRRIAAQQRGRCPGRRRRREQRRVLEAVVVAVAAAAGLDLSPSSPVTGRLRAKPQPRRSSPARGRRSATRALCKVQTVTASPAADEPNGILRFLPLVQRDHFFLRGAGGRRLRPLGTGWCASIADFAALTSTPSLDPIAECPLTAQTNPWRGWPTECTCTSYTSTVHRPYVLTRRTTLNHLVSINTVWIFVYVRQPVVHCKTCSSFDLQQSCPACPV